MTKNTSSGAKMHRESPEQKSHQTAKIFHDGFRTKQQQFSLSSALAHRFFPGLKSRKAIRTALTEELWLPL